jgi:hypothetical protein
MEYTTMKIPFTNRTLSLQEGPVGKVISVAKARFAAFKSGYTHTDLMQDPTRTFTHLRKLRNMYKAGGYISTGIDLYPLWTIAEWYTLESDDEAAKKKIEQFLDEINFNQITTTLMTDALVVRDGIAEIVYGNGMLSETPVNILVRPAECFEFDTDIKGKILQYTQKNDNQGNYLSDPPSLKPHQVLHYQFALDPTSPYGVSLFERAIHDIQRDTRVIDSVTDGIVIHGTPKWQAAVNKNSHDAPPLSDADWTDFKEQFKDINAQDTFPTEGDVELIMHDTQGVPNVQQYSDVTAFRVCAAEGVPAELVGFRQGTSDSTAVSRITAFYKQIKLVQKDIERLWNVRVIDKVTGKPGLVKMKLNSASIDEFLRMSVAISQLRGGIDPDAVCPADFARERLGIPKDEELPEAELPEKEIPVQESGQNPSDIMGIRAQIGAHE